MSSANSVAASLISIDGEDKKRQNKGQNQTEKSTNQNSSNNEVQNAGSPQGAPEKAPQRPRYFGMDLLRVLACYMVMQIHAGEFYYIGEGGVTVPGTNSMWVGILNSFCRLSVPLFVMISGYLLLPVKTDLSTFMKTRFTRVFFPFVFFCIVFSFYFYGIGNITLKQAFINIPLIFVNYGTDVGHLWYIYMIMGVYLFSPIISPWIKTAPVSHYIYFFVFWGLSMCLVYIHLLFPAVWGECYWNNTPMLQSFTGHMGYAILGAFVKIHLQDKNLYWLGAILVVVGYVITATIFILRLDTCEMVADLELSWTFHSINVGMETLGFFLLLRKVQCKINIINKIFQDISLKSYGMFLVHIIFLNLFHDLFDANNHPSYIFIPLMAICTFITSYIAIKILSYIPYSQYIIG